MSRREVRTLHGNHVSSTPLLEKKPQLLPAAGSYGTRYALLARM